jgi:predicted hydrocarbon binding protein
MHGMIFSELKKYVDARLGAKGWEQLLAAAKMPKKQFFTVESYPDSDAVALVSAASRITGKPAGAILEDFGEFITPDLMAMYGSFAPKEWKTLDFLANVEKAIHRTVRLRNPGADPPRIQATRTAANEVTIVYSSQRKMCALARGLARGVGRHFGEQVTIDESTCMSRGAPSCTMRVSV